MFIVAEIVWKAVEPAKDSKLPQQYIQSTTDYYPSTVSGRLGHISLEITILKKLREHVRNSSLAQSTLVNERCLTDEAFRPNAIILLWNMVASTPGTAQNANSALYLIYHHIIRKTNGNPENLERVMAGFGN